MRDKTNFTGRHLLFIFPFLFLCVSGQGQAWKTYIDSAEYYHVTVKDDKKAAVLADSAMAILRRTNTPDLEFADYCSKLGTFMVQWDLSFDAGKEMKRKAIDLYRVLLKDDPYAYAKILNRFFGFFLDYNSMPEAETYALEQKEFSLSKFGDTAVVYATACYNLAICYTELQQFEKAEKNFLTSYDIYELKLPDSDDLAGLQMELGILYLYLYQFKKSEEYLLRALAYKEIHNADQPGDLARINMNISALYSMAGDGKKSLFHALKAAELAPNKKGAFYYNILGSVGLAYYELDQLDSAKKFMLLHHAFMKREYKNLDPITYADACENLGHIYSEQRSYVKAESFIKESLQIYEKQLGVGSPSTLTTYTALGKIYFRTGRLAEAKKCFQKARLINEQLKKRLFSFQSEEEKKQFLENNEELDDALCTFYFQQKNAVELLSVSLANKNLLAATSNRLYRIVSKSKDSTLIAIYAQLKETKDLLAEALSTPVEEREEDIRVLESKANELEKSLVSKLNIPLNANSEKGKTVTELQKGLAAGDAIIDFFHFYSFTNDKIRYFATIIRPGQPVKMIPLFYEDQLKKLYGTNKGNANGYRGAITINTSVNSASAYQMIWKPLEMELQGISNIYYSPSGLLHKISFSSLPIDSTVFLSDRYRLTQLSSLSSFSRSTFSLGTEDDVLLYGGVKYTLKDKDVNENQVLFPYLQGTRKEVDSISARGIRAGLKPMVFTGFDATEETIKTVGQGKTPAILHFATHGFFFPDREDKTEGNTDSTNRSINLFQTSSNPLLHSGLLFAGGQDSWDGFDLKGREDGILTAFEASNLFLPETKLVVLSACESGLGDIQGAEGVYGLQRAFKMAGVDYLVMSLWKVPDLETSEFMEEFYQHLFAGETIENSYNRSQQFLKNKYRNDVYKWGAWVLLK